MEETINQINNFDQNGQILNIIDDSEKNDLEVLNNENTNLNQTENISEKTEKEMNNTEKIEKNSQNFDNSPNLGKFKDVSSLLSAYNNLQAEFTKKCQKLSELTKNCDNNACALPQEEWAEKVNTFLSNNKEAKPYANEISEILLANTELYNSENALEKAWTKVLLNNVLSLKQKMQDKSFVAEVINGDEELKQNIINDYVATIKNKQSPTLMDKSGTSFLVSKTEKALNLEDASTLVRAMFK